VKTYYELIYNNRYEPAAGLQTEESQKILTAADIEARYKQVKMTSARLAKVFDAVIQGNLAVVGDVRLVRFAGNSFDSAIVGAKNGVKCTVLFLAGKAGANSGQKLSFVPDPVKFFCFYRQVFF